MIPHHPFEVYRLLERPVSERVRDYLLDVARDAQAGYPRDLHEDVHAITFLASSGVAPGGDIVSMTEFAQAAAYCEERLRRQELETLEPNELLASGSLETRRKGC